MTRLLLALSLLASAGAAEARLRVISTTGKLTADGRELKAGDVVPARSVRLASGTAVLETDAGRFLVKGPAEFTPKKAEIRVVRGGLLSVLPRLFGRQFKVRTPTAVAAVRGTDFFVAVESSTSTYVCACRGKLEVKGKAGFEALEAENHKATRLSESGKAEAGLEHHTDAELDELRAALKKEDE